MAKASCLLNSELETAQGFESLTLCQVMEGCPAGDAGPVLNAGGAERPGFRLRHPSAKFCKCQQEKDSLGRFFEGQLSVKVGRVRVP